MRQYLWHFALFVFLVTLCQGRTVVKRQTIDPELDPAQQETDSDENSRDKRKVDAGFGVKNAVLGFVFNKLNTFIDQKTAWVDQLDRTNIAKNQQHNIHPPQDPVVSLSGIISGVIGQKLQAAAPLIGVITNKLTSGSAGGSGSGGFNIGALFSGSLGGSSGGGAGAGASLTAGYDAP